MGDLIFNPTARPGDPDWRVHVHLHAATAASGEQKTDIRNNPQRLDTLVGKILRIIPDLKEHVDRALSAKTAATGSRMTIRSHRRPAPGKRSGPTACATRIA